MRSAAVDVCEIGSFLICIVDMVGLVSDGDDERVEGVSFSHQLSLREG